MLWRVTGCMQDANLNVTHVEDIVIVHCKERVVRLHTRMKDIFRAGQCRKPPARRYVVGVNVRVNDITNVNLTFASYSQVEIWLFYGVAHGAQAFARSTEEIRNADHRRCMQ